MMSLQILALTLQLADGLHTCHGIRNGFREANPLLGTTCTRILLTKGALLVPVFTLPKGSFRTAFAIGNIGAGSIGVSVSIYNRTK